MQIKVIGSSSKGNATLIGDGRNLLMIDCGISSAKLKNVEELRGNADRLKGILISHEHKDHCSEVERFTRLGIPAYLHKETAQALSLNGHRTHIFDWKDQFRIGEYKVKAIRLAHDVPNTGFLITDGESKLFYGVDTAYLPFRIDDLTHLLVECNYSKKILLESGANVEYRKRVIRNHMSIEYLIDWLSKCDLSRLKEIHLLHLSDAHSDEKMFEEEVQKITGVPVYVAKP